MVSGAGPGLGIQGTGQTDLLTGVGNSTRGGWVPSWKATEEEGQERSPAGQGVQSCLELCVLMCLQPAPCHAQLALRSPHKDTFMSVPLPSHCPPRALEE